MQCISASVQALAEMQNVSAQWLPHVNYRLGRTITTQTGGPVCIRPHVRKLPHRLCWLFQITAVKDSCEQIFLGTLDCFRAKNTFFPSPNKVSLKNVKNSHSFFLKQHSSKSSCGFQPSSVYTFLKMKLINVGGRRHMPQHIFLPAQAYSLMLLFLCVAPPRHLNITHRGGSCSATCCAFVAVIKAGVAQGCVC